MNCSIRKNSSKIKGWTELHYHLLPGFESLSRRQNDSHCDGSGWAQSKKSSASGIQHRKMFQAFLHNEAEELRCQSFAWLREPQPTAKRFSLRWLKSGITLFFFLLGFFLKVFTQQKIVLKRFKVFVKFLRSAIEVFHRFLQVHRALLVF